MAKSAIVTLNNFTPNFKANLLKHGISNIIVYNATKLCTYKVLGYLFVGR